MEAEANEKVKDIEAEEADELYTNPVFTWFDCRGRRGEDLKELPAYWPSGLHICPDRWRTWLPEDWLQGQKFEPSRKRNVFVSPEGRCFQQKADVEKYLGRDLEEPEKVPEWPEYLPHDWAITIKDAEAGVGKIRIWLYPDGDGFSYVEARQENFEKIIASQNGTASGPRARTSIALPQATLQRLREAGRRARPDDSCDGYSLQRSAESEWSVLPHDVVSISLDVFSKHLQDAGWKVVSQTPEQFTFTGQVGLTLFCSGGKLLIRSDEQAVALDIAERYLNWLSDAP